MRNWQAPLGSPQGQLTLLYDLTQDLGERRNLAQERPEVVERLTAALDAWQEEMAEPNVRSTRGTATRIDGVPVELIF